jgi:hypothetical protein
MTKTKEAKRPDFIELEEILTYKGIIGNSAKNPVVIETKNLYNQIKES